MIFKQYITQLLLFSCKYSYEHEEIWRSSVSKKPAQDYPLPSLFLASQNKKGWRIKVNIRVTASQKLDFAMLISMNDMNWTNSHA